jgi:RNA polymerase sigma-70 factor (ECF subfamily)
MDTNKKQYGINDYAEDLIHHKARQLVGKAGFTRDDVEDLEQEMRLDLLERLLKFDPNKATYNTFVSRLVERKISNMIRHRTQEIRDYRREVCSLNEEIDVGEDEPIQRIATISQDEHNLRTGKYSRPAGEHADLHLDIEAVLADLPPELRQSTEMLATMPITQVARKLEVPRSTFYENHLAQLRAAFEAKGLGDYLP